jgi:hypothetical protein
VWFRKAIREWVRANGNEQVRGGGRGVGGHRRRCVGGGREWRDERLGEG